MIAQTVKVAAPAQGRSLCLAFSDHIVRISIVILGGASGPLGGMSTLKLLRLRSPGLESPNALSGPSLKSHVDAHPESNE